jgi:outer membrane receptor for ferrienterochelin and colicin
VYTVEVRAIGFEMASKTGIVLTLGQRYTQDFQLTAQVVVLQELEVNATTDPLINSARTGPAQIISDSTIHRAPLLGRNFTSLLSSSPQVQVTGSGGASIAGQNNRYNTILVDGSVNNDLFGLAAEGTPGGQSSVKPLSIEAIQEFQVLVAPFDVRQGGFAGGLVNAVTKSGTNAWSGSLFGYFQNRDLVGKDTVGNKFAEFTTRQFGGTISGPFIKDRMHLFAAVDIQQRDQPFVGNSVTDPTIGIPQSVTDRVAAAIRSQYGFDPGNHIDPVIGTPNQNIFAKISYQANDQHYLELSHNLVKGHQDQFSRSTLNRNNRDGFQLSNSGFEQSNTTNSTRLKWIGHMGRFSTEFIGAFQTVRDKREMPNEVPLFLVGGNIANNSFIAAGGERFSHGNQLDQNIGELTFNATTSVGDHQLTVGTHNEFFTFYNVFWQARYGVWTFNNVDSLEAGRAQRYEILMAGPDRPAGPVADWGVKQYGLYAQDQWLVTPRLTLTFGARIDIPTNDKPSENPALTSSVLGINTSEFPSGNILISPRLGFNYDISGDNNTVVRGGVGIFSGRLPYVWLSNAFTGTGLEAVTLTCTGTQVPAVTADISNLPTTCVGGGAPSLPAASIVAFDKDFKFVQSLRYALGLDHRLPWGIVGTFDFVYTQSKNTMYLTDENIDYAAATTSAEGRRQYGTISSTGSATPRRLTASFRDVLVHTNRSEDWATSVTGQLVKRFSNNLEFAAGYTYSQVRDLITLGSSIAFSNYQNTVVEGSVENRTLSSSAFEVPHNIFISATANLPLAFYTSLSYNGRSGRPYAYIANGDVNADGISTNDALYIPESAGDISLTTPADFARLDEWIQGEECLTEQRGQIMRRNSCRNPFVHAINMRFGKRINTFRGQSMEITADVFNFLNLLNSEWGVVRSNFGQSSEFEQRVAPIRVAGFDAANNRPIYSVDPAQNFPVRDQAVLNSSRWRMQLGLKYVF